MSFDVEISLGCDSDEAVETTQPFPPAIAA